MYQSVIILLIVIVYIYKLDIVSIDAVNLFQTLSCYLIMHNQEC